MTLQRQKKIKADQIIGKYPAVSTAAHLGAVFAEYNLTRTAKTPWRQFTNPNTILISAMITQKEALVWPKLYSLLQI